MGKSNKFKVYKNKKKNKKINEKNKKRIVGEIITNNNNKNIPVYGSHNETKQKK